MIRAGLFLYDHLAQRRSLPARRPSTCASTRRARHSKVTIARGSNFSDGWVDDARLVVANAIAAKEHGATVMTRARVARLRAHGDAWLADIEHAMVSGKCSRPRSVANVAGAWVAQFLDEATPVPARRHPHLIRGSHIVVPELFDHGYAYLFQTPDGRVVFAIPYEQDFTLIGTTEREYLGDRRSSASIRKRSITCCRSRTVISNATSSAPTSRGRSPGCALAGRKCGGPEEHPARLRRRFRPQWPAVAVRVRRQTHDLSTARRKTCSTSSGRCSDAGTVPGPLAYLCPAATCLAPISSASGSTRHDAMRGSMHRCCNAICARTARASSGCSTVAPRCHNSGTPCCPVCTNAKSTTCDARVCRDRHDILYRRSKLGLHLPRDQHRAPRHMAGRAMTRYILALDQGTTSSRSILFDHAGSRAPSPSVSSPSTFPRSGWVEHDAEEIWATQSATIAEVLAARAPRSPTSSRSASPTSVKPPCSGTAHGPAGRAAIVWQDRRTRTLQPVAGRGARSGSRAAHGPAARPLFFRHETGLAARQRCRARQRAERGELAFGTIDSWLIWNLTGGRRHLTDASNASRTLLLNLATGEWDDTMLRCWAFHARYCRRWCDPASGPTRQSPCSAA
jgi:hypothetical protein